MPSWTTHSNAADVLSLGPRTAGRLMRAGVRSVADLLAAKPQAVARRVGDEKICADTVAAWQCEAQLVLAAPKLPRLAAQFFAELGYSSLERIARSTPMELLAVCETAGRQGGCSNEKKSLPSIPELTAWICCAREALADRAA